MVEEHESKDDNESIDEFFDALVNSYDQEILDAVERDGYTVEKLDE